MRLLFDIVSSVVLGIALLSIVGGLALAVLGLLAAVSGSGASGLAGGITILWGLGGFVQGCVLAMLASYCQLRVAAHER